MFVKNRNTMAIFESKSEIAYLKLWPDGFKLDKKTEVVIV